MPLNSYKNSVTLVSIIIPTLNAGRVLIPCLKSIVKQNYPHTEIIIADGGSTDNTIAIANKFKTKIVTNQLKTAEAGKAIGLKYAKGQYIAFIDSDNILPYTNWLSTMLIPFKDSDIVCTEPIRFTYRRNGGFIERYGALLGANDPYAWFTGVYDRYSYLTNNWTGLKLDQIDNHKYISVNFNNSQILPTIGANGTIFRASFLKKYFFGHYLFDIDILSLALQKKNTVKVAKLKTGIIHTYCESSISKFIRKQTRRLTDMYQYQSIRQYNWHQKNNIFSLVKSNFRFALYSILVLPALFDSVRGYLKKADSAWFFHPIACFLSFIIYTRVTVAHLLGIKQYTSRQQWQQ